MKNQENKDEQLQDILLQDNAEYKELLALDYCGFRLNSLAKKIKSEYLKFRKMEQRLINP